MAGTAMAMMATEGIDCPKLAIRSTRSRNGRPSGLMTSIPAATPMTIATTPPMATSTRCSSRKLHRGERSYTSGSSFGKNSPSSHSTPGV